MKVEMTHEIEFTTADFVILKVVKKRKKKWKINFRKEKFFLPQQNFADRD